MFLFISPEKIFIHNQGLIMSIIEFPFTKSNRVRLVQAFRKVARVELSIDRMIEGQTGRAYVDVLTG
jgi:hypothetical protein